MPYITPDRKVSIDPLIDELCLMVETTGDVNYTVCKIMLDYLQFHGESYNTYNSIIGILECAKQEFYRRMIAKYEDEKIKENGDIFL